MKSEDYRVTRYLTNVVVNKEGEGTVQREVSYYFYGPHQGVYLSETMPDDMQMTESKVSNLKIKYNDGMYWHTPDDVRYNRHSRHKIILRIYDDVDAGYTLTVRYTVHIRHLAKRWQDDSQIHWSFINGWDVPLENTQANIMLPKSSDVTKVWVNDSLGNHVNVKKRANRVTLTSDAIRNKSRVAVRMLFDRSALNHTAEQKSKDIAHFAPLSEALIKLIQTEKLIQVFGVIGILWVSVIYRIVLIGKQEW